VRRRELLTGITGLAAAAISARSKLAASSLETLRVDTPARLHSSSFYLADELGYFRQAGFELEVVQMHSTLNSVALLAGGKADIHLGSVNTALLNAIVNRLPIRIVAGRDNTSCGNAGAIFGLRRTFPRGLGDLKQLKGKRIATGPAVGLGQFSLDAQLGQAGLSSKDVTIVRLPFDEIAAALVGGGIDACVGADEFERTLGALGSDVVESGGLAQVYPDFQFTYIIFGRSMLSAGVDHGARFLSAYLRGAREFAHGKTPRYLEDYARSNHLTEKQIATSCRNSFPLDGKISLDSLRLYSNWAARNDYISRPVDVAELVDDRFLRKAHAS
jgi:ABC-type nitrate/sulfonate/bicarbonate transport system substrate-binding protein